VCECVCVCVCVCVVGVGVEGEAGGVEDLKLTRAEYIAAH